MGEFTQARFECVGLLPDPEDRNAEHEKQLARTSQITLLSLPLTTELREQLLEVRPAFQALQLRVVPGLLR